MALGSDRTTRSVSFAFVILGLGALAAGLGVMLAIAARGAWQVTDAPTQKLLLRLAWLSLVLLCVTLVLLLWAVLRHVRYRLYSAPPLKPSQYVDAWELAGRRLTLDDADDAPDDAPDGAPDGGHGGE